MPDFAQLKDAHPILPNIPVANRAKGSEALAQAFGQVSQVAAQTASQIDKEHSNAMLMNSASQSNSIMTDAKIQMLKHPENAEEIQKSSSIALDKAGEVPMRATDRSRFNYLNSRSQDSLKLQSASIGAKQSRMKSEVDYMSALPKVYSDYQTSLLTGDEKSSDILYKTITENAKNALMGGVITPAAYENSLKTLEHVHSQASLLHSLIGNKNATASHAQSAGMNVFSNNNLNAARLPSDSGTQILANHHTDNMVKQDINSSIYGMSIDLHTMNSIMKQTPAAFANTTQVIHGSIQAHGVINANMNSNVIDQNIERLNNKPDLTASETAELHVYNNYMKHLGDDFNGALGQTSEGAKNTQKWQEERGIANSQSNPSQRAASIRNADNNFMDAQVATATGQHIKSDFVNPVLTHIVDAAKSSMNLDADPNSMIQQMNYLKPRLRPYLAKQMGGGIPSAVGYWTAHGSENNMDEGWKSDMIVANQKGRDFSILNQAPEGGWFNSGKVKMTDPILRNKIIAKMPEMINYVGNQLHGQDRSASMVNSLVNLVKYQAIKHGDYTLDNVDDYIKTASEQGKKAFDISTGAHYVFNKSILPLPDNQLQMLSFASIQSSYKNIEDGYKHQSPNMSDAEIQAKSFNLNLTTSITDDRKIVVTNDSGVVYYSAPYSDTLLSHAQTVKNEFFKKEKSLSSFFRGKADVVTQDLLSVYAKQNSINQSIDDRHKAWSK